MNMKQHYRWHIYRVRTWKCIHITISFDASYVRGNWRGNSCWNVSVFTSQYSIKVWPLVHELEKISKYIYIYIYSLLCTKPKFFFFFFPYPLQNQFICWKGRISISMSSLWSFGVEKRRHYFLQRFSDSKLKSKNIFILVYQANLLLAILLLLL